MAHTAGLRASETIASHKEEVALQLAEFTHVPEQEYQQKEKRLRVTASAQISAIAEMKQAIVTINKLTRPNEIQNSAFGAVIAYRQEQSLDENVRYNTQQ